MKILAGVLFTVFVAVILVLVAVIQLIVQLMPLLIMGAVAYGVVAAIKRHTTRPIAPPGFMLVPVPPPPPSGPQLALPPPRRHPIDVEVFGPVSPGDSASPDRWEWR